MTRRLWALGALILAAVLIGVGMGWLGSGGLFGIATTAGIGEG